LLFSASRTDFLIREQKEIFCSDVFVGATKACFCYNVEEASRYGNENGVS